MKKNILLSAILSTTVIAAGLALAPAAFAADDMKKDTHVQGQHDKG